MKTWQIVVGLLLLSMALFVTIRKQPDIAERWGDAYRACVGGGDAYASADLRAACKHMADLTVRNDNQCATQHEEKP